MRLATEKHSKDYLRDTLVKIYPNYKICKINSKSKRECSCNHLQEHSLLLLLFKKNLLSSRMPRHSCCEMRVIQCMTYFFCTSLQFCTLFRSAQKLYQHPIDIHFFIRFSLTVAKIIILCFYLFPRKCFMFFFQIRNDICDSLSSKRTCHKYLLTTGES